jgi:tetratricopeptide (TPR) repeat protein
MGHFEAARNSFRQESELWRELGLLRPAGEAIRNLGMAHLLGGDTVRAESAFLESLAEFERVGDEVNPYWSLLGLARIALRRGQPEITREFLKEAGNIMEGRQDSEDQAIWWRLSGRLSLLQGDPMKAWRELGRALDYGRQAGNMDLLWTIVEFAYWYQRQDDAEQAARLLGFVRSQDGKSAELVQWRIEPLLESLAANMMEQELSLLMAEGAQLDRQAIIDGLGQMPNVIP